MIIKPAEIEIDQENPFRNDVLGRKPYIDNLTKLITSTDQPLVLSVSGQWGAGKTTFIKLWKKYLELQGYRTILFSAWESDFAEEPLPALISEFSSLFPKSNSHIKKIKEIGIKIAKVGIPQLIKLLTSGMLDLKDVTEETISNIVADFASAQIAEYSKTKDAIESFKNEIKNLASDDSENGNKIIVFIDELDRCKPIYSIETLEIVKHLFSVGNMIFILSIDEKPISSAIKIVYGPEIDFDGYFRRFIDIRFELPEPNYQQFCEEMFIRMNYEDIMRQRSISGGNRYDKELFVNTFSEFSKIYKLSLRDVEKCFIKFSIVLMTTPDNNFIFPSILA